MRTRGPFIDLISDTNWQTFRRFQRSRGPSRGHQVADPQPPELFVVSVVIPVRVGRGSQRVSLQGAKWSRELHGEKLKVFQSSLGSTIWRYGEEARTPPQASPSRRSLEKAEREHAKRAATIDAAPAALEKRSQAEDTRWKRAKGKLKSALRRGRD